MKHILRNSVVATVATLILIGGGIMAFSFSPLKKMVPSLTLSDPGLGGSVELITLEGDRRLFLYLPPGYTEDIQASYPVIYHLHGAMPLPWSVASKIVQSDVFQIASTIEDESNGAEAAIIVAPYDGTGLTMWSDSWDGNVTAERFVVKELKSFIESNYRVKTGRNNTTMQGFSMGGFGAVKIGFKYPELYGRVISWDGALHTWETLSEFRPGIASKMFQTRENFDAHSPWKLTESLNNDLDVELVVIEGAVKNYNQAFKNHLEDINMQFEYVETDCAHDMKCLLQSYSEVYNKSIIQ